MVKLSTPIEGTDHTLGADDPQVSLAQYGSYDCPHCAQAWIIVSELLRTTRVPFRFAYRHFPSELRNSPAHRAAEAAEAASKQGQFWEMHSHLLRHQDALDDANLLAYAVELGLDAPQFGRDLESGVFSDQVRHQFNTGVSSGVRSTPTFFINGVRHDDYWDIETLNSAMMLERQPS